MHNFQTELKKFGSVPTQKNPSRKRKLQQKKPHCDQISDWIDFNFSWISIQFKHLFVICFFLCKKSMLRFNFRLNWSKFQTNSIRNLIWAFYFWVGTGSDPKKITKELLNSNFRSNWSDIQMEMIQKSDRFGWIIIWQFWFVQIDAF